MNENQYTNETNTMSEPKKHTALKVFLVIIIIGIILTVIGGIWFDRTKEKYLADLTSFTKEFTADNISNIDLDTGVGKIFVLPADDNKIRVEATDVPENYYNFSTENQTFTIKTENINTEKYIIGLFNKNNNFENTKITVYLPVKEYNNLKLEAGVGETHISEINCKTADLQQGVGKCIYQNLSVSGKTKLDIGVGETEFSECNLSDTNIECGVGKLKFHGSLKGNLDIEGGVGDAEIKIDGSYNDYIIDNHSQNVQIEKGIDSVSADNNKYTIKADAGIGNIKITFK